VLDKKMNLMLDAANTLTADDLDCLRSTAPAALGGSSAEESEAEVLVAPDSADPAGSDTRVAADDASSPVRPQQRARASARQRVAPTSGGMSAGEYERQRTRESKVSTACIGHEREKHDWWPLGTTVVGQIGSETFTATVVQNANVKSNRSLLITSGPANGRICITPTRAAMEATEAYRQAHTLGRGGGVTNGWEFWKAQA
jgi:hypothetical protein